MTYLFESERLGFRNWEDKDIPEFAMLNADPEVMAFFPNPLSQDETKKMVVRLKKHYEENGYTFFAVDLLSTKTFIGFIGIIRTTIDAPFTPCAEVGWRLKKEYWNKGYASEGAKACLNFGFKRLGLKEIFSITAVLNEKSEYLMKKIGMTYWGQFDHPKLEPDDPLRRHVIYKIEDFEK